MASFVSAFLSFPIVQDAARVSFVKNMSVAAFMYPCQLLNALQYARW